jgi:hypothetical protein
MGATSGISTSDQAGRVAQGFTAQAIERLVALKRRHERGELTELTLAEKRLLFVRWLVEHGQLHDGVPLRRAGGLPGGTGLPGWSGAGAPAGRPYFRSDDGPPVCSYPSRSGQGRATGTSKKRKQSLRGRQHTAQVTPARKGVQRIGGSGIGLTSTRHIVEEHGGTTTVVSEPGRGATFTVRLPLAPLDGEVQLAAPPQLV